MGTAKTLMAMLVAKLYALFKGCGDDGHGGDGDDHESTNGIRNDVIKAVTNACVI